MIKIKGVVIMRKVVTLFFVLFFGLGLTQVQGQEVSRKAMVDSIKAIDSEVQKYFPRWKICETDLQIQIYKTFQLLGYPEKELDMTQIEVLAIPKTVDNVYDPYEILIISCGRAFMNTSELEANLGILLDFITGAESYLNPDYTPQFPRRDYCYIEIPPNIPVSENQAAAIQNYLEPTNVMHSITVSLFEQTLKIGDTDFWLKSVFGDDAIGYHYWSSGQAKIILKRPLYVNTDAKTSAKIPNLINAYLGGGYRITTGLEDKNGLFEFLPNRVLNGAVNGKIIAGFDFHLPMHPQAGVSFNYEPPLDNKSEMTVEIENFGKYDVPTDDGTIYGNPLMTPDRNGEFSEDNIEKIVPVLGSTGQFTLFYNWWLDKYNPENYFRFDVGISYSEVQEYAYIKNPQNRKQGFYLTTNDILGLRMFKPNEFADWLFLKAEFRSQAAYPFGMSLQMSNQILLGRLYLPLLTPWLYLEAKYATPLRTARPYEIENFFMISPVLRITI